jgi:hypothetical protein
MKKILFITILTVSPLVAQTTFQYKLRQKDPVNVYFGEEFEVISHFSIHLLIGVWRPDYSLVAAIAIETADTLNGRFDAKDWGARLTGCFVGYFLRRVITTWRTH